MSELGQQLASEFRRMSVVGPKAAEFAMTGKGQEATSTSQVGKRVRLLCAVRHNTDDRPEIGCS
jgi:hypothetical protein